MIPGNYQITIQEGATWAETWRRSGVASAAGWTAALDMRVSADETSARYIGLTSSPAAGLVLTSDGTSLIIGVTLSATQTAGLGFVKAFYDLKLTRPDGTVEYLLSGMVTVRPRVTP